ncbi:acyl-CoA thioesterase [Cumulibacter manganitolerans]|uniref:acyl-CoA thioesterase n=1 Tax=Cumulibacter manganitolerans TaxID=1884992 RepID=UPI001295EDA4|nr:thioesterase family protein [Cumulibacter manganitolerans]
MAQTYDYQVQLRWSDADRQGHINNGKFATYAEDARIEWFEHLPGREANVPSSGLILARQEIDYHRQVLTQGEPGKRMVMKCATLSVGRTSARIREELWGEEDTSPACTVTCVLVNFDYESGRPSPWSDAERSWIESFTAQED